MGGVISIADEEDDEDGYTLDGTQHSLMAKACP